MNVIDVTGIIVFVAQEVFPITVLPQGLFPLGGAGGIGDGTQGRGAMLGEPGLDQPPAGGKIGIAGRQSPDAVQMFGHDHHGIDLEWTSIAYRTECTAQDLDHLGRGQKGPPPFRNDGEEEGATRDECSPVLHNVMPGRVTLR